MSEENSRRSFLKLMGLGTGSNVRFNKLVN